jgi:hypothetical protein
VLNQKLVSLCWKKILTNNIADTDWERAPVSSLAKTTLWRIEAGLYSLTDDRVIHLGRQLPGYYGNDDPAELSFQAREHLRSEAWRRFSNMDLFFVKVCS